MIGISTSNAVSPLSGLILYTPLISYPFINHSLQSRYTRSVNERIIIIVVNS